MHASPARRTRHPLAVAVAATVAGTLAAGAPAAHAADHLGPGYSIPDRDGNAGSSHIGAYGPPGPQVRGDSQTYCADPLKKGPADADGYSAPKPVSSWTSSVTGKPVPKKNLAYASYVIGKYGQTQSDAQAAAVDAAVYEWLAGGAYAINGKRGKERLAYPVVSPTSRTLALRYIDEARKLAGPYTLTITPSVETTHTGKNVAVDVKVTSRLTGAAIPGVSVDLKGTGSHTATGKVTTDTSGTAEWEFTPDRAGTAKVTATAAGLPGSELKVLTPKNPTAQRMLLAGDTTTAKDTAAVQVEAAPGGVTIHKENPEGDILVGAVFQLLDKKTGTVVAEGRTDEKGVLAFDNIAPGIYTLRETSTGDTVHELVPDQDIVITSGRTAQANPITIVDPFKKAGLLLRKTDEKTGATLPGAVINIAENVVRDGEHAPGEKLLALTTGKDGTAKATLDVKLKAGTRYWATEITAPDGYQLNPKPVAFTAEPGQTVTVTLRNSAVPTTPPTTPPTSPPTTPPVTPPAKPPMNPPATPDVTPPSGSLAHTGADTTWWLLGGAGALLAAGSAAFWAARRRRTQNDEDEQTTV
ncbi:MSCRAMM family protein [Streptomyces uncialis]|uniref:MSCRAMM family protein n=1 Tax=Streptomyces uncialis TaxID=1048205 RepID=UPI00225A979F|nr:SpaA isopeptide-forming pilin-related protein [Streptomyces uncialis]MCX4659163.1 SpaA isopeptide-forming pilin-related protein [Streptomyces uncialis]